MRLYNNPPLENWNALVQRPSFETGYLESTVKNILNRVKRSGDFALRELTRQLDEAELNSIEVTQHEIDQSENLLTAELRNAIRQAAANIKQFHEAQQRITPHIETMPGVQCWRKAVPIQRVGIYIPGGSAPLFSTVLMLAIPASLAGCKDILLCSPPDKNGNIHPAILFAASITGVTRIFKIGGAQAIGALAYGTETIQPVYKIFGPGNQYVTMAKQLVNQEGVAIDMPAGPSEVLVFADEHAEPKFIAADLLSQAEHGPDSQVVLVAMHQHVAQNVMNEVEQQIKQLPRYEIAAKSLAHSNGVIFPELSNAIDFINAYAPEHLILHSENADEIAETIVNAGSVFVGSYAAEAIGDYASGTNHTLPTNGFAKAYAGVSLDSFIKHITFQKVSREGLKNIGPVVEVMAEAENLIGHKNAISVRLKSLT
jgi:histidinol dehydrogenase